MPAETVFKNDARKASDQEALSLKASPFEANFSTQEIGIVRDVRDFLLFLEGLPTIRINDVVESDNGIRGVVNGLFDNLVSVLLLSEGRVKPGQVFTRRPESLSIAVGDGLLGRTINPLGNPIDGKKYLGEKNKSVGLEKTAVGISGRQFIKDQFITGITVVDMLLPLGRGQRELILGDARSGKTSFIIDLIVNQKNTGVICVYAAIGKAITDVKKITDVLSVNKAFTHTVVVAATSNDPPPLTFLAPKTAMTIAEYFQQKGLDVLLILDDMGNHAKIYREIALLEERPPGRESYPGDIFYQHAHLLERAGNFSPKAHGQKGGSITALPVIEVNLTDFTTFIPTNVMAMTDGHLLFTSNIHNQGIRPAIDISLSVTRVGLQTQYRMQNAIAGRVKSILIQAKELESISRLSSELPIETQTILHQKELVEELIEQDTFVYYPREAQILSLALVFTSFLANKDKYFVRVYKKILMDAFLNDERLKDLLQALTTLTSEQELLNKLETYQPVLENICSASNK